MTDLPIGAIVVFTPPGTELVSPYTGAPRYVVVSVADEDGYVWLCETISNPYNRPDLTIEYLGDLTRVYS